MGVTFGGAKGFCKSGGKKESFTQSREASAEKEKEKPSRSEFKENMLLSFYNWPQIESSSVLNPNLVLKYKKSSRYDKQRTNMVNENERLCIELPSDKHIAKGHKKEVFPIKSAAAEENSKPIQIGKPENFPSIEVKEEIQFKSDDKGLYRKRLVASRKMESRARKTREVVKPPSLTPQSQGHVQKYNTTRQVHAQIPQNAGEILEG